MSLASAFSEGHELAEFGSLLLPSAAGAAAEMPPLEAAARTQPAVATTAAVVEKATADDGDDGEEFTAPPLFSVKERHWFDGTAYAIVQQQSKEGIASAATSANAAASTSTTRNSTGLAVVVPLLPQQGMPDTRKPVNDHVVVDNDDEDDENDSHLDDSNDSGGVEHDGPPDAVAGDSEQPMHEMPQQGEEYEARDAVEPASSAIFPAVQAGQITTLSAAAPARRRRSTVADSRHGPSLVCPAYALTKMDLLPRAALRLPQLAILDLSSCRLTDLGSGAAWRYVGGTLRVLYLHDNRIARYSYIESALAELFRLQHVTVAGNPVRPPNPLRHSLRQCLAQAFPNLLAIDEHFVLDVERIDYVAPKRARQLTHEQEQQHILRHGGVAHRDLYVPFSPHTHIGCERTSYQLRHASVDVQRKLAAAEAAERAARAAANGGVLLGSGAAPLPPVNAAFGTSNDDAALCGIAPSSAIGPTTTMEALVDWEWRHLRYLPLRAITLSPAALIQKCWRRYWSRKRFVAAREAMLRRAREKFRAVDAAAAAAAGSDAGEEEQRAQAERLQQERVRRALEVLRRVIVVYARARRGVRRMIERRVQLPGRRLVVFLDQLEMHRWQSWLVGSGARTAVHDNDDDNVAASAGDSGLRTVIDTPAGRMFIDAWFSCWPSWHTPANDRRELDTMDLCRSVVFASYTARKFLYRKIAAAAAAEEDDPDSVRNRASSSSCSKSQTFREAGAVDPLGGRQRAPRQRRYCAVVDQALPHLHATLEESLWASSLRSATSAAPAAGAADGGSGNDTRRSADLFQGLVLSKSRRQSLAQMMHDTATGAKRRASIALAGSSRFDDSDDDGDKGTSAAGKGRGGGAAPPPSSDQQQPPRAAADAESCIDARLERQHEERERDEDRRNMRMSMRELVGTQLLLRQRSRSFSPNPLRAVAFDTPRQLATFLLRLLCFNRQRPRSQIHFFFEDDLTRLRAAVVLQAWWRGAWTRLRLASWQYHTGGRAAVWNFAVPRRLRVGPRLLHFTTIQLQNWWRTVLSRRRYHFLSTLRNLIRGRSQSACLTVGAATLHALLHDVHAPVEPLFEESRHAILVQQQMQQHAMLRSSNIANMSMTGSTSKEHGGKNVSFGLSGLLASNQSTLLQSPATAAIAAAAAAAAPPASKMSCQSVRRRRIDDATCPVLEQNLLSLSAKLEHCRLSPAVLLLPELASVQRDALLALAFCLKQSATRIAFARKAAEKLAQQQQFSSTGWNWGFAIAQEAAAQRKGGRAVSVQLPMCLRCRYISPDVFFANAELPREALERINAFVEECIAAEHDELQREQRRDSHPLEAAAAAAAPAADAHEQRRQRRASRAAWERRQMLTLRESHFLLRLAAAATLLQGVEMTQFFTGEFDEFGAVRQRVASEQEWDLAAPKHGRKDHHHQQQHHSPAASSRGMGSLMPSPSASPLARSRKRGAVQQETEQRAVDEQPHAKNASAGTDKENGISDGDAGVGDGDGDGDDDYIDPEIARALNRLKRVKRVVASIFKSARKKSLAAAAKARSESNAKRNQQQQQQQQQQQAGQRPSKSAAPSAAAATDEDDDTVASPDERCPFAMGPMEGPLLHRVHWLSELSALHPRGYLAVSAATAGEALGRFLVFAALTWTLPDGRMLCPEPAQRLRCIAAAGAIREWWVKRRAAVRAERNALLSGSFSGSFLASSSSSGVFRAGAGRLKRIVQSGVFAAVNKLAGERGVEAVDEGPPPGSRMFVARRPTSATRRASPAPAASVPASSVRETSVPMMRPDSAAMLSSSGRSDNNATPLPSAAAAAVQPKRDPFVILKEVERQNDVAVAAAKANEFVCMQRARARSCNAPMLARHIAGATMQRRPTAVFAAKKELLGQQQQRRDNSEECASSDDGSDSRASWPRAATTTTTSSATAAAAAAAQRPVSSRVWAQRSDSAAVRRPARITHKSRMTPRPQDEARDADATRASSTAPSQVRGEGDGDTGDAATRQRSPDAVCPDGGTTSTAQSTLPCAVTAEAAALPPLPRVRDEEDDEDGDDALDDDDGLDAVSFHSGDDLALSSAVPSASQKAQTGDTAAVAANVAVDVDAPSADPVPSSADAHKQQPPPRRTLSQLGLAALNTAVRGAHTVKHTQNCEAAPRLVPARPNSATSAANSRPTSARRAPVSTEAPISDAAANSDGFSILALKSVEFIGRGNQHQYRHKFEQSWIVSTDDTQLSKEEQEDEVWVQRPIAGVVLRAGAVMTMQELSEKNTKQRAPAAASRPSSARSASGGVVGVGAALCPRPPSAAAAAAAAAPSLAAPNAAHAFHVACLGEQQAARDQCRSARDAEYEQAKLRAAEQAEAEAADKRTKYLAARAAAGQRKAQPHPLGLAAPLIPFSIAVPKAATSRPTSAAAAGRGQRRSPSPRGRKM